MKSESISRRIISLFGRLVIFLLVLIPGRLSAQSQNLEFTYWTEYQVDDIIVVNERYRWGWNVKLLVFKDDELIYGRPAYNDLLIEPQLDGTYLVRLSNDSTVELERCHVLTGLTGTALGDMTQYYEFYDFPLPMFVQVKEHIVFKSPKVITRYYDTRPKPIEEKLNIFYKLVVFHKIKGEWVYEKVSSIYIDKLPRPEFPKIFP